MESLATLHYRAQGKKDVAEKGRAFDDAAYWYQITSAQPQHKTAFYSLGVIAWAKILSGANAGARETWSTA